MRISVAMAVRNGEQFLEALLDSLARQTTPPAELVVSDDASDDATPRLLEAFAANVPFPVRIERFDTRRGHVEGFMRAAYRCRGDAIAFCDADDVWVDRKLETCGRELNSAAAMLVMHGARVVDADLRELDLVWPEVTATRTVPPLGLIGLDVDAPGMAMVFRREVLGAAAFEERPPSRYGLGRAMLHDEWVLFLAGVLGSVRLLDHTFVLYRQHGANDSGGVVERRRRLSLRPALDDYENAAEHLAGCARYLEAARPDDAAASERLAAGAERYREVAADWALRGSLYREARRRERAQTLRRLVARDAYRPRTTGGFGRAALGKDLLAGVALRVGADGDRS